jgi:hypothetical protein
MCLYLDFIILVLICPLVYLPYNKKQEHIRLYIHILRTKEKILR